VNQVVCRLVLSDGLWGRVPSKETVAAALGLAFPSHVDGWGARNRPSLASVEFEEPNEDEALVAVAVVLTRYCHAEIIRDDIAEAVLRHFRPEYDSMVEVEVLDE
jgi:hypothetical protein